MKIAIFGAGAVGCYYGGMLARAGHAVTLVGRARHVEAVQRDGLLLETQQFTERLRLPASTDAAAAAGADLVLVCVKSTATDEAAAQLRPHLGAQTRVLSLQNGVDNASRLSAALAREVWPAVVYVAAAMPGPGHVKHNGRGELVIGAAADAQALVQLFGEAGVAVQVSDNVIGALWFKLILNCAWNALSAITQQPYGELARGSGVEPVMRDVVDECLAVARASAVDVPGDVWSAVQGIARTMPQQRSSTAQDLAAGKPSEIDHLNGFIVRQGQALGVPTPVNRTLHCLVRLLESARRPASPHASTGASHP